MWLEEDRDHRPVTELVLFPVEDFKLCRKHVRRAIDKSNNSVPGPDGIPFAVWRSLGFQDMTSEGGPEMTADQYQDFNASLLFFLPRKASGSRTARSTMTPTPYAR